MQAVPLRPVAAAPRFSHIYMEEAVQDHEVTRSILKCFPESRRISIQHYKDVFSRPGQCFAAQKRSQQLILAMGRPPFLYRGSDVCPSFGNPAFYYASGVMNCIYDCEYCYLQGLYPCANLVIFVNIEEIFREIQGMLTRMPASEGKRASLYLCNSYDTDLLALRGFIPLADRWLDFAARTPELLMEMRTKSAATSWIRERDPVKNVIAAWTISPEPTAFAFEKGAPLPSARLNAARLAMRSGWRVRICIDPILYIKNWEEIYSRFIRVLFEELDPSGIENISIGPFRMGRDFLKRARKVRSDSGILHYPFVLSDGVYSYPREVSEEMASFMIGCLEQFLPAEKIVAQEAVTA